VASYGVSVACYVLAGLSCAIIMSGMSYTIFKRKSYTIKAVNFVFCMITQGGSMLLLLSPVFIVGQGSVECMAWMWLLGIGFTLFIVPLVLKIYRLDRIFDISKWEIFAITNLQLLACVGAFLAFQTILLIIWSVVDPLTLKVISFNNVQNTQVQICSAGDRTGSLFFVIEVIYAGLLLFVGCVLSARIRNQKVGAVNESREMLFTVYNITIGIIVIVAIGVVLSTNASSWTLVISVGTTIVSLSSWASMYLMKFWRIFSRNEQIFHKGALSSGSTESRRPKPPQINS